LAAFALGPLAVGIVILRRPGLITSQTFPSLVPATGPYTPEELDLAESQLRQYSGPTSLPSTAPTTFTQDQIQFTAEGLRKLNRARREVWDRNHHEALQQARARRPVGFTLVTLGIVLAFLFGALAWNLRSPTRPGGDPLL
jgi:hypothetical protein